MDILKPSISFEKNPEYALYSQSTVFDTKIGVTAIDDRDGDITERIDINGNVDLSIPGTYTINYKVEDTAYPTPNIAEKIKRRNSIPTYRFKFKLYITIYN